MSETRTATKLSGLEAAEAIAIFEARSALAKAPAIATLEERLRLAMNLTAKHWMLDEARAGDGARLKAACVAVIMETKDELEKRRVTLEHRALSAIAWAADANARGFITTVPELEDIPGGPIGLLAIYKAAKAAACGFTGGDHVTANGSKVCLDSEIGLVEDALRACVIRLTGREAPIVDDDRERMSALLQKERQRLDDVRRFVAELVTEPIDPVAILLLEAEPAREAVKAAALEEFRDALVSLARSRGIVIDAKVDEVRKLIEPVLEAFVDQFLDGFEASVRDESNGGTR